MFGSGPVLGCSGKGHLQIPLTSQDLEETVVGRSGSPILSQWFPNFTALGGAMKTPKAQVGHHANHVGMSAGGCQEPVVGEDTSWFQ